MGWDGSIETLSEHKADANGEGEWGYLACLGPVVHPLIYLTMSLYRVPGDIR